MNDATPRLWTMRPSDDVSKQAHHLSIDSDPPRLYIRNADTFVDYLENDWATTVHDLATGRCYLSPPPPLIELTIVEEGFAPDLLIHETLFVSASLREAMAFEADDVQWCPVDTRWSTAAVQAKDYKMLHPTWIADPIDRARSEGIWFDTAGPEGETGRLWVLQAPEGEYRPARVRLRDDFVAPAPLFNVVALGTELVTDALVERVRRAGLPGIAFENVTHEGGVRSVAG